MKKYIIQGTAILVVLIAVIAGIISYQNRSGMGSNLRALDSDLVIPDDWDTYSNSFLGFQIQYPADEIKITEAGVLQGNNYSYRPIFIEPKIQYEYPETLTISFSEQDITAYATLEEYVRDSYSDNLVSLEHVMLDGVEWIAIVRNQYEGGPSTTYFTQTDTALIGITFSSGNKSLEQIAQSFSFTPITESTPKDALYHTNFRVEPETLQRDPKASLQAGQPFALYFSNPEKRVAYYKLHLSCPGTGSYVTTNKISGNLCDRDITLTPPTNFIQLSFTKILGAGLNARLYTFDENDVQLGQRELLQILTTLGATPYAQ